MTQINNIITASEGMTFVRLHDGFEMGEEIYLGIDFSTGEPREDRPDFYKEVAINVTEY
jgi:hypothetical protein